MSLLTITAAIFTACGSTDAESIATTNNSTTEVVANNVTETKTTDVNTNKSSSSKAKDDFIYDADGNKVTCQWVVDNNGERFVLEDGSFAKNTVLHISSTQTCFDMVLGDYDAYIMTNGHFTFDSNGYCIEWGMCVDCNVPVYHPENSTSVELPEEYEDLYVEDYYVDEESTYVEPYAWNDMDRLGEWAYDANRDEWFVLDNSGYSFFTATDGTALVICNWVLTDQNKWMLAQSNATLARNTEVRLENNPESDIYYDMNLGYYCEMKYAPYQPSVWSDRGDGTSIFKFDNNGYCVSHEEWEAQKSSASSNVKQFTDEEIAEIARQYLPYGVTWAEYNSSINLGVGYYVYFNTNKGMVEVKLVRDIFGAALFGGDQLNQFTCEYAKFM